MKFSKIIKYIFIFVFIFSASFNSTFAISFVTDFVLGAVGGSVGIAQAVVDQKHIDETKEVKDINEDIKDSNEEIESSNDKIETETEKVGNKETRWDKAFNATKGIFLQSTIREAINWVNTGFDGSPAWGQTFRQTFEDGVKRELDTIFLSDTFGKGLCEGFKLPLAKAINFNTYSNPITEERYVPKCTLENAENSLQAVRNNYLNPDGTLRIEGIVEVQENKYSWDEYLKVTNDPSNNIFKTYFSSVDSILEQAEKEEEKTKEDLENNDGFRSLRNCDAANWEAEYRKGLLINGLTPEQVEEEIALKIYEKEDGTLYNYFETYDSSNLAEDHCPINTPGSQIANQLSEASASGIDQFELADELDELFKAVLEQAFTKISENSGLSGTTNYDPIEGISVEYLEEIKNEYIEKIDIRKYQTAIKIYEDIESLIDKALEKYEETYNCWDGKYQERDIKIKELSKYKNASPTTNSTEKVVGDYYQEQYYRFTEQEGTTNGKIYKNYTRLNPKSIDNLYIYFGDKKNLKDKITSRKRLISQKIVSLKRKIKKNRNIIKKLIILEKYAVEKNTPEWINGYYDFLTDNLSNYDNINEFTRAESLLNQTENYINRLYIGTELDSVESNRLSEEYNLSNPTEEENLDDTTETDLTGVVVYSGGYGRSLDYCKSFNPVKDPLPYYSSIDTSSEIKNLSDLYTAGNIGGIETYVTYQDLEDEKLNLEIDGSFIVSQNFIDLESESNRLISENSDNITKIEDLDNFIETEEETE